VSAPRGPASPWPSRWVAWLTSAHLVERRSSCFTLADDLDIGLRVEACTNAVTHQFVVVEEEHVDHPHRAPGLCALELVRLREAQVGGAGTMTVVVSV